MIEVGSVSSWGAVLVVPMIGAVAALGWPAYNAGLRQGSARGGCAPLPVAPFGMERPHFIPPFGFRFLGCMVPLAFLFLARCLFRLVVCGSLGRQMHGGWGSRGAGMPGGMRKHWRQRMND